MTRRRADISASLAARGRPECWANEQESAVLSGMDFDKFKQKLPKLEAGGFPKISPWNGKRFIPMIDAFWNREAQSATSATDSGDEDERTKEKWDDDTGPRTSQRRAS